MSAPAARVIIAHACGRLSSSCRVPHSSPRACACTGVARDVPRPHHAPAGRGGAGQGERVAHALWCVAPRDTRTRARTHAHTPRAAAARIGYHAAVGVLKGGMPAWRAAGLPVTATAPVDPVAAIPEARARGYTLLDVRTVDEFSCADNGHVRDAVNVPAASLPFVLEELDKTLRYVVYCGCVRVSRRARVRLCVFVLACARLYECVRTVCLRVRVCVCACMRSSDGCPSREYRTNTQERLPQHDRDELHAAARLRRAGDGRLRDAQVLVRARSQCSAMRGRAHGELSYDAFSGLPSLRSAPGGRPPRCWLGPRPRSSPSEVAILSRGVYSWCNSRKRARTRTARSTRALEHRPNRSFQTMQRCTWSGVFDVRACPRRGRATPRRGWCPRAVW